MCWCSWVVDNMPIDFIPYLITTNCPHSGGASIVAATGVPVERVYVTATPPGSRERDIAVWENKMKDVGRQFVAFCPNSSMRYLPN